MKVAIYSQVYKEVLQESLDALLVFFRAHNIVVYIEEHFCERIISLLPDFSKENQFRSFVTLDESFDYLIALGGDGTILRSLLFVKGLDIPIIGVNTGRLGFLSEIQQNNLSQSLERIFIKKHFTILERSLLEINTTDSIYDFGDFPYAMNEIAISRFNTASMITLHTTVNSEFLTSYWADGLIVSTPTGSTGYSLSCGGPILMPNTASTILTPIAAHNLSARPMVIPDDYVLDLSIDSRESHYVVSLDSRLFSLPKTEKISIKKSPFKVKMVMLEYQSFIKTLRKKLLWGQDKRN